MTAPGTIPPLEASTKSTPTVSAPCQPYGLIEIPAALNPISGGYRLLPAESLMEQRGDLGPEVVDLNS
jgi:hypothetical protein